MKTVFFLSMILILSACQSEVPSDLESAQEQGAESLQATPEENMHAEWVTFGDEQRGYLVRPTIEGKLPAIVMIHEWWGVNDNIREMAQALAAEEYVVLAVDLYKGRVASTSEQAGEFASQVRQNVGEAIEHMKSAVSFLRERDFVMTEAVASLGWCFGGGMSMQLSLNERLAATVIYNGALETDPEKLSSIQWPVLGVFADQDAVISVESVQEFEQALNQLGIENEIYLYEGVGHAFANPSNPGHDAEKTEDAWSKTVAFLNRTLKQAARSGY